MLYITLFCLSVKSPITKLPDFPFLSHKLLHESVLFSYMRNAASTVCSVDSLHNMPKSVVACLHSPPMLRICPKFFRLLNSSHSAAHGSVKGINWFLVNY